MRSDVFAESVLDERVTLVTGGGTGLGKAAARELAACGAHVVIAGRREDVLAVAVQEIGPSASHVAGDVRDPADAERIVRACLDRHGRLDVLVNNAGGQYFVPAEAIATKGWQAVTRLNIGGTELMSRTAAELAMRPAQHGTIVNVTLSPHHGLAGMTHSSAARAAVEGYTRALAREWAADGIAVVALAAGHFDTESLRKYPGRSGAPRPARSRSSASAGRSSTPGSSRSPRPRSAARCRARWSRSTARATTGSAPGRRRRCSTTRARSRPRSAARAPDRRPCHGYHRAVACGRSVVVAQKPSKLLGRVRFPSPA